MDLGFSICLKCGKVGDHYSVALRGFTCQVDLDNGKLPIKFDVNGNEEV